MGNLIFQFPDSNGAIAYQYVMSKGLLIATLCIVFTIAVLFYVLRGVGLYTLAKRQGYKKAYLAWIPFCWVIVCAVLTGEVSVFGKKFKNFHVFSFIVVLLSGLIAITNTILVYIPLANCIFSGDNVIISSMSTVEYPVFTSGIRNAYKVLTYIDSIISLLEIFVLITLFFGFFKKYWPERSSLIAMLSFFGLFPVFAFVVRKKNPVDYQSWLRARYQAFFAGRQNPYGNAAPRPEQKSPFEEFDEKKSVDPFEDFPDKKDGE